ncbi:MAG: helix-turn-helix domain-containing protein [Actinomycetota bacterium]
MSTDAAVAELVRTRLKGLRQAQGLSLDDVAGQTHLSASTISRIENGKRTISLDVLVSLASALGVSLDALLEPQSDDDVVIRPEARSRPGVTTWNLSRPTGSLITVKQRIEESAPPTDLKVHPGYDWFFVLSGTVRLALGDREILVEAGEAAEFDCMTPHAFSAAGGPAEIISIFDHAGQRAHLHTADG